MHTGLSVNASAPFWIQDNPCVLRLLHTFLNQLENGRQTKVFAKPTSLPELFDFDTEPEKLWEIIEQQLEQQHRVIKVELKTKLASHAQPYEGAKLTLNHEQTALVREWLARPEQINYSEQWAHSLQEHAAKLPNAAAFSSPIISTDFDADAILAGFTELHQELLTAHDQLKKVSLRTLSARCFAGDSKFLDQRRAFVEHAFPLASEVIEPRAIMLSAYIPEELSAALFVENFDSFRNTVRAVEQSDMANSMAVIYSAGYRGSANLIRSKGHSRFVTINHVTQSQYQDFANWWFSSNQELPVYFWGDLDFEGMNILKALRNNFATATAFQAAYSAVLTKHQQGVRHPTTHSNKGKQSDPGHTGCKFADVHLLPAIRKDQAFTDQEVLCQAEIAQALHNDFLTND